MRPGRCTRALWKGAAAAGLLSLSLAASAGAEGVTPPPPGPRCELAEARRASEGMAALVESLRRAPPRPTSAARQVVPLDNHGYAYRPEPYPLAAPPQPAGR
jgi:hypothetical protein